MRYVIIDTQLDMYGVKLDNRLLWTTVLDGASTFTLAEACPIVDELNHLVSVLELRKPTYEVHIINSKNELFKVEANLP